MGGGREGQVKSVTAQDVRISQVSFASVQKVLRLDSSQHDLCGSFTDITRPRGRYFLRLSVLDHGKGGRN